jgi:hypothetical protein
MYDDQKGLLDAVLIDPAWQLQEQIPMVEVADEAF